jgi:hypothetical protein
MIELFSGVFTFVVLGQMSLSGPLDVKRVYDVPNDTRSVYIVRRIHSRSGRGRGIVDSVLNRNDGKLTGLSSNKEIRFTG